MKSFAVLAFAGLVAAQLGSLPSCATSCAGKFLAGGSCGSDPKCICSDTAFLGNIACCLAAPGGCDAADQAKAVAFAAQICNANGVSVPSVVSCSTTPTGTATTLPSTAAATTPSTAATATPSGTGSTASSTASTSATTSASAASAAATDSSKSTAGAPHPTAGFAGVIGGLVAALAML